VVATPIGNLEDITLRALRILREVQLIAAEDTRRTAKLLSHYSIGTRSTSLHEHNEIRKTAQLLARLQAGDSIAIVSDAGTPLISDPGTHLVKAARQSGIRVVAIPGASAVLTALAASGVGDGPFVFLGFPPRRSKDLQLWVRRNLAPPHSAIVFYEAPHRIRQTLEAIASIAGDRPILVARELTKIHEELVERPISTYLAALHEPKGEFTVIVPPRDDPAPPIVAPDASVLAAEIGRLTEFEGSSPRAAARAVAERYGLSVNEVYKVLRPQHD
jgi:16S rRNA (cytidine1402-2'-O)-methyltransferase